MSARIKYDSRLISISNATDTELIVLARITEDKSVMRSVGRGEVWSYDKLVDLRQQSREDDAGNQNKRQYYHWLLLIKHSNALESVQGYVGLHPYGKLGLQLRTLVGTSGLGYGTIAGNLAVQTYYKLPIRHSRVWSVIAADNTKSLHMREKNRDWLFVKLEPLYGKVHKVFVYNP